MQRKLVFFIAIFCTIQAVRSFSVRQAVNGSTLTTSGQNATSGSTTTTTSASSNQNTNSSTSNNRPLENLFGALFSMPARVITALSNTFWDNLDYTGNIVNSAVNAGHSFVSNGIKIIGAGPKNFFAAFGIPVQ